MFPILELVPVKNDLSYVKIINGRWSVNGKNFNECSLNEQRLIEEKVLNL